MAVECTHCEEKVNSKLGIYVKCTQCPDMKLCLDCFSSGVELGDHESDHPYELIDCGSFSIIDETWKACEELALLEAIELYGIGSWTDIANAVGTRTPEECSDRYLRVYVENFFGRCAWNAIDKDLYTVKDHTSTHKQPLSPSLSLPEKHKVVDISRDQQIRLGYMPKRDDFEREYDNGAELLVSKLAVNASDDTELDQDLKIAHINMYTDKLRERFRRKRIVLEYNLVRLFFHMHSEENGDSTMHKTNLNINATKQNDYSVKINNASSLSPMLSDQVVAMDISETFDPSTDTDMNKSNQALKPVSRIDHTDSPQPTQKSILSYFQRVDQPQRKSTDSPQDNSTLSSYFNNFNKTIAEQDFNSTEKKLRIFCQFSSAEDHNRLIHNLIRERELKERIEELIERRKNGISNQASDAGWRLLTEKEKKLCKSSNLKPAQYMSLKASLIKDHNQKKKKGATNKPSTDASIDKNVRRKILDFLTRNSWIKV